jgi:lipoate-protein ligase A
MVCQALVEAYRALGVEAELTARPRGARGAGGACYLHTTAADLSLGAAKLSGSAQVWSHDSCLQHGSFVLSRDADREAAVFRLDATERAELIRTTSTISEARGDRPGERALEDAVIGAFERTLGITLEPGDVSDAEREAAERGLSAASADTA